VLILSVAELETFMENHTLQDKMRSRLREHFLHRKHVRVAARADRVTLQMSAELQAEVLFTIHGRWISKIPFLHDCEKACVVQVWWHNQTSLVATHACVWLRRDSVVASCMWQVAMVMHPNVFAPAERPAPHHFYVIKNGLVAYGTRMLSAGKMWGEEIVTASMDAFFSARCMTCKREPHIESWA
jgi:hypothetical protein